MPKDIHGVEVAAGMRVRILRLSGTWLELPDDERVRVLSMIGGTFLVDEIDEYGAPWVTKAFAADGSDRVFTHSIALRSDEMLVVDDADNVPLNAP